MTSLRPKHRLCSSEKTLGEGHTLSSGDDRLRAAIIRRKQQARSEDPRPYDESWGWWVEDRIARLEKGQTWLVRIAIGALAAEILRIIMVATGVGG